MRRVKLGDVAVEVRETSRNTDGLPAVGLEHLTPGDLHLSQWSETSDNTFTKFFHEGQILFGRRRAYLKKAAVAPFDGICSGDITVIAANPEKILPRLLPFIIGDDRFFDYAMEKSAGSLSPRVKWAQLAEYEFDLPEKEKQPQLADLLWAMERAKKAYQGLLAQTDELVKSQFVEMFGDQATNPKGIPSKKLSSLASLITKGASPTWQGYSYTDDSSQTLFVTSENVREGTLDLSEPKYLEDGFNEKQGRSMLKRGDFLINIVGASIGRAARFDRDCKANINQAIALVRMGQDEVLTDYMLYYLNSPKAVGMYNGMKSAVARANLSLQDIGDLEIIIPPISDQQVFSRFLQQINKSKLAIRQTLESLENSRKAIMKKVFG